MLLQLGMKLISGISQKVSADNKRKKAIAELDKNRKELDESYRKESNKSYLDSGEGKSHLMLLNDQKKVKDDALANSVVSSGATAEAEVAKAAAINKNYADSVSRLAAVGSSKKEAVKEKYDNDVEKINDRKADLKSTRKNLFSYLSI